jgi:hypothetical protein
MHAAVNEPWDAFDVLIACLASGAVACLYGAAVSILGHLADGLIRCADDKREANYVRWTATIIAGSLLAVIVAGAGVAIRLLWIIWTA